MEEMDKHGQIGKAAMKAGMDPKTARKYLKAGKLPSELKEPRSWRTREDPFKEQDWEWVLEQLELSPALEARTLFDALQQLYPGRYQDGQLRTLQRRIKQWRAESGPEKEVFFQQEHIPGEALQADFTDMAQLEVTIAGEPLPHLLFHCVLPYSNWEWAKPCSSESFLALKGGLQGAVLKLGRRPEWCQTDNTSAATHDLGAGKRGFNADYIALVKHFGMKPRKIKPGKKEENGDVESSHRVLKKRIDQHLMLRGSRDFDTGDDYVEFLDRVMEGANRGREKRFAEELAVMPKVTAARLPEFTERDVSVTTGSTIRVERCTYSVPSSFKGERLRVRVFEDELEVFFGGRRQFSMERVRGRGGHRIDYRHVIWSLVRKPGAFARYRYREDLFPTEVFRKAYDVISRNGTQIEHDLQYLRLLYLAASTIEAEVEAAIAVLLEAGKDPTADAVKELLGQEERAIAVPQLTPSAPDLTTYDALLEGVV